MNRYVLTVMPTPAWTRLLLTDGQDEMLRATLPTPALVRHPRAARTLLEGLSLWLDCRLRVVLCVAGRDSSFCLELTDELGRGVCTVFYTVEVMPTECLRSPRTLRGVSDFRLLHRARNRALAEGDMP